MKRIVFLLVLLFPSLAYGIDFVFIGHVGNPSNPEGYGHVTYGYYIGKYEITNKEYCAFLNCVASTGDPYNLFSMLMEQHFMGGIVRDMVEGGYRYHCKAGYERRPIVCTSWMNAIRFANWLHYNSLNIERNIPIEQWSKQTEGDATHGAYDTRTVPHKRNKDARYWLPNRSEWEKAAYYDGKRWNDGKNAHDAIVYRTNQEGWMKPYPHIAVVGNQKGPNGTYDQLGNAAEWVESSFDDNKWKLSLGGSLIRPSRISWRGISEGDDPNKAISTFGFRICKTENRKLLDEKVQDYVVPVSNDQTSQKKIKDLMGNEYVLIQDVGNVGDPMYQYKGSVYYEYAISKTELSNEDYCRFLNAVAVMDDPYHLYNLNMGSGVCGGILRKQHVNGQFHYVCKPQLARHPVVYISFYDLARYANWMHYGCPKGGISRMGTTEGDADHGAYDTRMFEAVRSGESQPTIDFGKRNKGALYWIPSDDEWYKAAYYDPTLIGSRQYHNYQTRTPDEPDHTQANYMINNTLCVGAPFFTVPVDSFENAKSYYGTLNQGGNVWEWTDDWQYGVVGNRGLRGGSWSYTSFGLHAINTDPGGIDDRSYVFGGRLCKAVTQQGWVPVGKPVTVTIYEFFRQLSPLKSVLFMAFSFIATLWALVITCVVIVLLRRRAVARNV